MKFDDDYLWNGEGEPDGEVARLEDLLGRFRHEGKAPEMPLTSRRIFWPRLAVAAAVIVMLLGGLWLVLNRQSNNTQQPQQATAPKSEEPTEQNKDEQQATADNQNRNQNEQQLQKDIAVPAININQRGAVAIKRATKRDGQLTAVKRNSQAQDYSTVALVDFETANHLESAQLFLRSFRNITTPESEPSLELSYEKQRSKELLYRNIVLRRDAAAKGNLPINNLLGSLEPILLDIANMPENSEKADVRSIQERIEKKEIVAAMQVYSVPVLGLALGRR